MRSASAANATQPLSLFSSLLSAPPLEIHLHASLCTKIAVPSNNDDRSGASPETRAIRIELYSLSDQTNDLLQGREGNKGGFPSIFHGFRARNAAIPRRFGNWKIRNRLFLIRS